MEDRVKKLEQRVQALEEQLAEIRQSLSAPSQGQEKAAPGGDGQRVLELCRQMGVPGSRIRIFELRKKLDWEEERFNQTLDSLAAGGEVRLHAAEAFSLSIKQMGESFVSESGELFTEMSLAS